MREFVQEQRNEEQNGGDDGGRPDDAVAGLRHRGAELPDQREADKESNDEPAVVQAYGNTGDSTQGYLRTHSDSPPELKMRWPQFTLRKIPGTRASCCSGKSG